MSVLSRITELFIDEEALKERIRNTLTNSTAKDSGTIEVYRKKEEEQEVANTKELLLLDAAQRSLDTNSIQTTTIISGKEYTLTEDEVTAQKDKLQAKVADYNKLTDPPVFGGIGLECVFDEAAGGLVVKSKFAGSEVDINVGDVITHVKSEDGTEKAIKDLTPTEQLAAIRGEVGSGFTLGVTRKDGEEVELDCTRKLMDAKNTCKMDFKDALNVPLMKQQLEEQRELLAAMGKSLSGQGEIIRTLVETFGKQTEAFQQSVSDLRDDLTTETKARVLTDGRVTGLGERLTAETEARVLTDGRVTGLGERLTAETEARVLTDGRVTGLGERITVETIARETAVDRLTRGFTEQNTKLNTAVSTLARVDVRLEANESLAQETHHSIHSGLLSLVTGSDRSPHKGAAAKK